jgi:hypothetical protein
MWKNRVDGGHWGEEVNQVDSLSIYSCFLFIKKGDRQDNKSLDFSGLKREKKLHLDEIKLAKNQVLFINLLYLTKFAVIAFR